jgi:hypothetical protein
MANRDNPGRGAQFEKQVQQFFRGRGLDLRRGFEVDVGAGRLRKPHSFDLGSLQPPVLVECKHHTWTRSDNVPSAKLTVWNEAMYYFAIAPAEFRKILFVLKSVRRGETLAQYYISHFGYFIPPGVELWEYDPGSGHGAILYIGE